MAVLLQNRTISMILTVPDVEILSSSTPIIEKLDRSDIDQSYSFIKPDHSSDIDTISSMPVYQGSIVRIEQHSNDENVSDLIIRVPNFQRLSPHSSNASDNQQSKRIKRRAPICPILYGPNPHLSTTNTTQNFDNLNQSRIANTNRLTTGLRSLSRAFTHSCKSKRSSSISEITMPSALPDVEVMTEKLQISKSANKNLKHENSSLNTPKLIPPKILCIKRKHFKIRKKQSTSSISINKQIDQNYNQINLTPPSTIITTQYTEINETYSPKSTTFFHRFIEEKDLNQETNVVDDNDNDNEQDNESIRLRFDVEQQFAAISQLISDIPVSSMDDESLSTHRYSTISGIIPEIRISMIDNDTEGVLLPEQPSPNIFPTSTGISYEVDPKSLSSQSIQNNISPKIDQSYRIQTSMLQPDISVIRIGTNDLTTQIDHCLPGENISNEQIDSTINMKEKFNDGNDIEQDWNGIIHSDNETFAECYEVIYQLDPQYQNEYEQIEQNSQFLENINHSFEHLEIISKEQDIIKNKSRSVDDLSRTSNDQTSTFQNESIASSSSKLSSRHCTLQRSNSSNDYGISISTDIETRRKHFIRQVDDFSPGEQAGLKENDRILCINGTSVINEDYTVVLQLIKHGLQTDTLDFDVITNDTYEQFKAQIDQLYQ